MADRPYDADVHLDHSILDFFEAVSPGPSIEGIDRESQAGQILHHLATHSPATRTTAEMREALSIENVSGRIGELRAGGWAIDTVSRRSARDHTAEYRLRHTTRRPPRQVDISLEVVLDNHDGLTCRIRPTGLSDTFSPAQLDNLRGKVEELVEEWMDSMQEEADDLQVEGIEEPELNLWNWLDEVDGPPGGHLPPKPKSRRGCEGAEPSRLSSSLACQATALVDAL